MSLPASDPRASLSFASLWRRIETWDLVRIGVVLACTLAVALGLDWPRPQFPVIAIAGLLVGLWPILIEAAHDLKARRMSMELSMLIAIAAAAAIGEWVIAGTITAFVLAAEILEDLSMDRGRDALTDLMSFLPTSVQIREGGVLREVPISSITAGETVVVSPGGRIPADGTITEGASSVDQSRITGESMPIDVAVGDLVHAGSVNLLGALAIRVERPGAESSYGQIVKAVYEAQSAPAPVQRLADRLAAYVVYFALAAALVTLLFTRDLHATISVVIVAGACGIAAGTPLALLAGLARAARNGAFVKGGVHLENLSQVDTVIFDKTGTLTVGRPSVLGVFTAAGFTEYDVVGAAAAAELLSEHPLGKAIVEYANSLGIVIDHPSSFEYQPGLGLTAQVGEREVKVGNTALVPNATQHAIDRPATPVYVSVAGTFVGTIYLADALDPTAKDTIAALHRGGLRVLMLTGDAQRVADAIAAELGIDEVRAELLPEQKSAAIRAERQAGHRIAMVGDGVNDTAALTQADVGIAIGAGTAVARESADVILISSDLNDLVRLFQLATRVRRIVLANFIGTLVVDLIGIALAAFSLIGPLIASIIHVGSETVFILNSARLIPVGNYAATTGTAPREVTPQRSLR